MARVLVVDDDPQIRDMVSSTLEAAGHAVARASDGAEACAVLDRGGVDIVVTDLNMPIRDGFGVKAHVSAMPRPVPVIIISGTWTPAERTQATRMGFARMYDKPADLAQVLRDIAALAP